MYWEPPCLPAGRSTTELRRNILNYQYANSISHFNRDFKKRSIFLQFF